MIDFPFQGRIRQGIDDTVIDTSPTQSMAEVLAHADLGVIDLLEPAWIAEATRRRSRPFRVDAKVLSLQRERLGEVAESGKVDSAQTAALAAVAATLRWTTNEHLTTLIAHCGSARGLVSDCCTYLTALSARYDYITTMPTTSA
jgi:hypothetical protein